MIFAVIINSSSGWGNPNGRRRSGALRSGKFLFLSITSSKKKMIPASAGLIISPRPHQSARARRDGSGLWLSGLKRAQIGRHCVGFFVFPLFFFPPFLFPFPRFFFSFPLPFLLPLFPAKRGRRASDGQTKTAPEGAASRGRQATARSKGSRIKMVWSRSGPVDTMSTPTPVSSSMRLR